MTDNNEEKVTKFLQSEDSALRKMGLSLIMGAGLHKSCHDDLFAIAFFDPEESNRETGKTVITKYFPDLMKELKSTWKNSSWSDTPKYDPYQISYDFTLESFLNKFHSNLASQNEINVLNMLVKAYYPLCDTEGNVPESHKDLVGGFVKFWGSQKYQPSKEIMISIFKQFGEDGPGREVLNTISIFDGEDIEDMLIENLFNKGYFMINVIDDTAKQLAKMGNNSISKKLVDTFTPGYQRIKLLQGGLPRIRDIIWCLGKLGNCNSLEDLINFCRETLFGLKLDGWEPLSASAYAVAQLSHCDEKLALEYLYELADNRSEWVIESAVYAMGIVGSKNSITKIEDIMAGKRARGHSGGFGWGHYMPLTKKTGGVALDAINEGAKLDKVNTPWPPHHEWTRSELDYTRP
jgi:hypothetical protein